MVRHQYKLGIYQAHRLFDSRVQILLDALPVEDVPAPGLNSVFSNIIAKAANSCLVRVLWEKRSGICFASQHQVRVACHLTHASEANGKELFIEKPATVMQKTYRLKIFE